MRALAGAKEADAFEQSTVRHASRCKNNLLSGCEVVCVIDLIRIAYAHRLEPAKDCFTRRHLVFIDAKFICIEDQAGLNLAIQTLHRSRSDNTLRRPANSH